MSNNKKNKRIPIDLSIRDTVQEIKEYPLIDRREMKLSKGALNLGNLKYHVLEATVIKELGLDENEENIIVNGKIKLPINGKLKSKPGDVLIDEGEALAIVVSEVAREKRKAWLIAQNAEKCVEGLEQLIDIYLEKAKKLGISITVEDADTGEVIADTDSETELGDREEVVLDPEE